MKSVDSADDPHEVRRVLGKHPSGVLLIAQFVVLVAYPFLDGTTAGRATLGVFQMLVIVIAVWAVRRTPALSWVVITLGAPAMIFAVLEAIYPSTGWVVLTSAVFHVPFYLYVSYAMLRYLFHDDKVTVDELYATGAAFTVVAWAFAYLYAATQVLWPGSFVDYAGEGEVSWFRLLYLSLTILTSVGLSDVIPVGDHARSVAMIEQVAGVFYIAMVVARLVGLIASKRAALTAQEHRALQDRMDQHELDVTERLDRSDDA